METPYDWITVMIFAGLVVVFLQRSVGDHESDPILNYVPAVVGCAVCNWLGNEGYHLVAVVALVALAAYVWFVIKPMETLGRR